jgi:DNA-binding transcriptional LysR family regulator
MDLSVARTFLEVCRSLHFGKAADNLHVTTSAVSARIRSLEEELDTKLFIRLHNEIALTEAGRRLIPEFRNLLQIWEQVRYSTQVESKAAPNLRVSFTPGVWDSLDLGWVSEVRQTDPALKLQIGKSASAEIFEGLQRGQIDLGFTVEPHAADDLRCELFTETTLHLYSDQPDQTGDDIVSRGYIHVNWGTSFTSQFLSQYPDYLQSSITVSTARIAADVLKEVSGMFYAPASFVEKIKRDKPLYRVSGTSTFQLSIYVSRVMSSPKLALIDRLLGTFQSRRDKLSAAA